MAVNTVPDGYPAMPVIATERANEGFDFLVRVFGAELLDRYDYADGKPMYITARVGDTVLSFMQPIDASKPTRSAFYVYVPDVDGVYSRAVEAGAKAIQEPGEMVHGDRAATFLDILDNQWTVATRLEDISVAELHRRAGEALGA